MGRPAIPAEAFDHGDPKRYRRGCRCRICTNGVTAEVRRGRFLRATGRGHLTSTARAARHIEYLRTENMPDLEIMTDALISQDVLYRVVRQDGEINRSTEIRILAVRPRHTELPGSGTHIPGIGTTRRLRALAADGWTATELARRCRKHKQFIVYLQNQTGDPTVRRWVADYVNRLCQDLAGLKPEDHGTSAHIAQRTRDRAARKGWVGTAYWDEDDFDNPDFTPAVSDDLGRSELAAHRKAEITRLDRFGVPEQDIARRLDMDGAYVHDLLRDLRGAA